MPKITAYSPAGARDVLTASQMRAAEQAAMASGLSGLALMERAGRAAAAEIVRLRPQPGRAAVLCGLGANGGDGFVVARLLQGRGWDVALFSLVARSAFAGDARRMAELWEGETLPAPAFDASCDADVLVDALFGIGLSRPVEGEARRLIEVAAALRARPSPFEGLGTGAEDRTTVPSRTSHGEGLEPSGAARHRLGGPLLIAIDIASGVAADTGEILGAAFPADVTVTFHALKPGHVTQPGGAFAGEIVVADIGLGPEASAAGQQAAGGPAVRTNDASALVARIGVDVAGHKYSKGHALVLAGGLEGVGAARLAARAALRAGAGLVTLGAPASALLAHASRGPDALMVRRCEGTEGLAVLLADKRRNAVVLGPALGVGAPTREAVRTVLASGCAVVLDADALTSFAGDAAALAALTRAGGLCVLTPHEGEFARLFSDAPRSGRLQRALWAAAQTGAVMVLKGPGTIIAAPDGRAAINVNAPPWLGTAGSGDVLAGLIGGLLAQGFSPYDAACCGVFLHGEAGRVAGRGLIADDLPEAVWSVLKEQAPRNA